MNSIVKTEITFEKQKKCYFMADNDCSLGEIYDFSCALKSFVSMRIHELENQKQESDIHPEEAQG